MSEYKLDRDKDYKIEETKNKKVGDELEKGHNTNTKVKEDDNNDNGRKKKKQSEEKEAPEPEIFRNLKTNLNNPARKAQFLDEIVDYIGQYAERSMSQSEIDAYKRIVERKLLKELTGLKKLDID